MKNSKKTNEPDLTSEAFSSIRRMIFSNVLKPDQKILYRNIAKDLHISLTPVVQALKHLEFMGLVSHEPNKGYRTTRITQKEVLEGFELRSMIECFLIPKIINGLTKAKQDKLKRALDDYCNLDENTNKMLILVKDINFHMTLAEISEHERSVWILRYLFDIIYLRIGQSSTDTTGSFLKAKTDHTAIYDAIVKKDIATATERLRENIESGQKNILKSFEQESPELLDIVF